MSHSFLMLDKVKVSERVLPMEVTNHWTTLLVYGVFIGQKYCYLMCVDWQNVLQIITFVMRASKMS